MPIKAQLEPFFQLTAHENLQEVSIQPTNAENLIATPSSSVDRPQEECILQAALKDPEFPTADDSKMMFNFH